MLFTLVSGGGSPGVTTTALGLASVWPRPVVLVEADPGGGSAILAGFFRGQLDAPGLVDLVIAQRSGVLAETLPKLLVPIEGTNASVLLGARSPEQSLGLAGLWSALLTVLRSLAGAGTDVIVDAGRLGMKGSADLLVAEADLSLMVCRTDLPSLAASRAWAHALSGQRSPVHTSRLLLVGEGQPYSRREVEQTLGVPAVAVVSWAPAQARVFSHGEPAPESHWWQSKGSHGWADSDYVRSLTAAGSAMAATVADFTAEATSSITDRARALLSTALKARLP